MNELLLAVTTSVSLNCGTPKFKNVDLSRLQDAKQFAVAVRHCREHHPRAPCVVKFERLNTAAGNDYSAICGREKVN